MSCCKEIQNCCKIHKRTHTHTHMRPCNTNVFELAFILTPGVFFLNLIFLVMHNEIFDISFLFFHLTNNAKQMYFSPCNLAYIFFPLIRFSKLTSFEWQNEMIDTHLVLPHINGTQWTQAIWHEQYRRRDTAISVEQGWHSRVQTNQFACLGVWVRVRLQTLCISGIFF